MPAPVASMVGWIGLGALGLPMAVRAKDCGWDVWACDASSEREDLARRAGIQVAPGGVVDVAERAERLVACVVRDAGQVWDALLGDGMALRVNPRLVGIVMSSTGTEAMGRLSETASARGATVVAAPVLGNPVLAAQGDLVVPLSGHRAGRDAARPLLESLAHSVVDLGDEPGAAQAMKMISQLLQIVGMVATFEGVQLGRGYGLRDEDILEVIAATEPSWTTANWDYAADLWRRRDPATSLGLFAKDLSAASQDAASVGLNLPLLEATLGRVQEQMTTGGVDGQTSYD